MRLIHTRTGSLHSIDKPSDGSYVIVSYLWSPENDQSYQDVLHIQNTRSTYPTAADTDREPITLDPRLSPTIQSACQVVSEAGYDYVWFQSCCVDRSNGAELSDALNSLWDWYSDAGTCFAYLADVPPGDQVFGPDSQFRQSKWHQDAWALQALVAPRNVVFLARDWSVLGTKRSLALLLEDITGIDRAVLKGEHSVREASVARRMWWVSKRHFPCPEDEAYALLGLFGVQIPVTYGEGVHAFMQLQEEIFRSTADQTLFAWHYHLGHEDPDCLFAAGPCCFARSGGVKPIQYHDFTTRLLASGDDNAPPPPRQLTSSGVSIRCALIPHAITTYPPTAALYEVFGVAARFSHVGVLQCEDESGRLVVLSLDAVRGDGYAAKAVETTLGQCDRVWTWSPALYREAAAVRDIVMRRGPLRVPWIGRARPAAEASAESPEERGNHARIVLQEGVRARLAERGFNVACELARRELVDDLYPRERRARRLVDVHVFSLSSSAAAALPGASLTVEVLTRRFDLRPVTLDSVEVHHPVSSDAAGTSSAPPAIQPYQSSRDDSTRTLHARYIIEEDGPQGAWVLELNLSGRTDINAGYLLDMKVLSLQGSIVHSLLRGADKSLNVQNASSARQSYGAGRVMDVWPRVPGLGGWTSRRRGVVIGT